MGLFHINEDGTLEGELRAVKENIELFEQQMKGKYRHRSGYILGFARGALDKAEEMFNKEVNEQ